MMSSYRLLGVTTFSKLHRCEEVSLSESSKLLSTFHNPLYNKLPFGISSAAEHFQRWMSSLLEGLQEVLCVMDNILIFRQSQEQHDNRFNAVVECLSTPLTGANVSSPTTWFSLAMLLTRMVCPLTEPSKTTAINQMNTPKSVSKLRQFLGMINQLGKFSPNIAELSHP